MSHCSSAAPTSCSQHLPPSRTTPCQLCLSAVHVCGRESNARGLTHLAPWTCARRCFLPATPSAGLAGRAAPQAPSASAPAPPHRHPRPLAACSNCPAVRRRSGAARLRVAITTTHPCPARLPKALLFHAILHRTWPHLRSKVCASNSRHWQAHHTPTARMPTHCASTACMHATAQSLPGHSPAQRSARSKPQQLLEERVLELGGHPQPLLSPVGVHHAPKV